jgi:FixJ family two-component response regulator
MPVLNNAIVLVVDDDDEYRDIHRRHLEGKVRGLFILDNRLAAMELIQRQFFHAALLDIRLIDPEEENVEGLEIAKAIYERGESTGIVIVSGYGTTERSRTAFRKYRAVDFLEKSTYTPDQLFEAIEDAVTDSAAYIEQARQNVILERYVQRTTLDIIKRNFDEAQQHSFAQVFNYLVQPLAPLTMSVKSQKVLDGTTLEIRCWSRFYGNAYTIRIGLRSQIRDQLDLFRQAGLLEDNFYTIGYISGFRYVDSKSSSAHFSWSPKPIF